MKSIDTLTCRKKTLPFHRACIELALAPLDLGRSASLTELASAVLLGHALSYIVAIIYFLSR